MRIQPGSKWLCTDEDYPEYGKTCVVIDPNDDPDFNGDGDIEVKYDDDTIAYMKVRRFLLRHEKVKM